MPTLPWVGSLIDRSITLVSLVFLSTSVVLAQAGFEDVSDEVGLVHGTTSYGAYWSDVNGDLWPDLFLTNHMAAPVLLVNDQQGGFVDMSTNLQSFDPEADMHGAAWADFDNDGDQDLIILTGSEHSSGSTANILFVNDAGVLTNAGASYGLDYPTSEGRTPQWIDIDSNGLLDVVVNTTLDAGSKNVIFRQTTPGVFSAGDTLQQAAETSLFSLLHRTEGSDQNLLLHSFVFPSYQYEWDGGISAVDISPTLKSSLVSDAVLTDVFNDGAFELIVSESRDFLSDRVIQIGVDSLVTYLNGGDGTRVRFRSNSNVSVQMSPSANIGPARVFLGTALNPLASYVEDGPLVTFSVDHSDGSASGAPASVLADALHIWRADQDYWMIEASAPIGLTIKSDDLVDDLTLQNGSTLSDGASWLFEWQNGRWQKVHRYESLDSCKSIAAGDMDNNGLVDLVHLCGPGNEGFLQVGYYSDNGDDSGYELRIIERIPTQIAISNDTVTLVDYDRDGSLDIYLANGKGLWPWSLTGSNRLYRNTNNGNHWAKISLHGTSSNRDGTGALVKLKANDSWQYRIRDNGGHAAAQNDPTIHFGLANAHVIDSLVVEWPSGQIQHLADLPVNRELIVTEGEPAVVVSSEVDPETVASDELNIYPNPVRQTATLQYSSSCSSESSIDVYSVEGRLVLSRRQAPSGGSERVNLNVEKLPAGVYLVRRTACASASTARLVKL